MQVQPATTESPPVTPRDPLLRKWQVIVAFVPLFVRAGAVLEMWLLNPENVFSLWVEQLDGTMLHLTAYSLMIGAGGYLAACVLLNRGRYVLVAQILYAFVYLMLYVPLAGYVVLINP
jgi:hypothetical protein